MDKRGLAANIPKYYVFSVLYGLQFFIPIYVIFLLGKGLSFTQVMLLEGLYSFIVVGMEIPTGYFADVKGRRASLLVAGVGYILALSVFVVGSSFVHFALAMVLWALAGAFFSGADSALLYDTLLSLKREKEFAKILGIVGFLITVSAGVASLIGGFAADLNIVLPFVLSLAVTIGAVLIIFLFKEPPREKLIIEKGHLQKLAEISVFALRNRTFMYLVAYTVFLAPIAIFLGYLVQPFVVELGLPLSVLGVLYAAVLFISAVGMLVGPRLYHRFNIGWQLLAMAVIATFSAIFLAVSKSGVALVSIGFMALAMGTTGIVVTATLNRVIPSDKRATVLSLANMIGKLSIGLLAVVSGPLLDLYSLRPVTFAAALISLVGCGVFAFLLSRERISPRTP